MTREDLARLTKEERGWWDCLPDAAPAVRDRTAVLLGRLALARRVVEAARETAEAMNSLWGWLNVPPTVRDGFQKVADAIDAHDAEVG